METQCQQKDAEYLHWMLTNAFLVFDFVDVYVEFSLWKWVQFDVIFNDIRWNFSASQLEYLILEKFHIWMQNA